MRTSRLVLLLGMSLLPGACRTSPSGPQTPPADAGTPPVAEVDAGTPPAEPPSCEPTMDWRPRTFDGPVFYVSAGGAGRGSGTSADPWTDLQDAIEQAPDGAVLALEEGTYRADATPYTDPSCGNCAPEDQHPVPATRGFLLTGKSLSLMGAGEGATVLHTHAGYGVLVEDACEVHLSDLTITGGVRDADGAAADGAVVVRRSRVVLEGVSIRDNTALMPGGGYPGIAGLMLREGADALVMRSTLDNNSWDGVTAFDDGRVRMYGSRVANGKGVAVGITWSGRALLVNNELSGYWKGLGAFVDAQVVARNNVIHHHVGWGAWATGRARLDLVNNTIAFNDILGVSIGGSEVTGTFVNNVVAYNGLHTVQAYPADVFGGRMGLRGGAPSEETAFAPAHNVLYGNQVHDWTLEDGATPVDAAGFGTNVVAAPRFYSESDLRPRAGSPLIDAGDPAIRDADGSVSDVGATGGPDAERVAP